MEASARLLGAALTAVIVVCGLAAAGPASAADGPGGESVTVTITSPPGNTGGGSSPAAPGNPAGSSVPGGSGTAPSGTPGESGGELSLTVLGPAAGGLTPSPDAATAIGSLPPVSVSDTRASSPGWVVSGQATRFAGAGGAISGNALGWTPAVTAPTGKVTPGHAVAPDNPGLGSTAAALASSAGDSTATLGAALNLAVPAGKAAGTYRGTITVTAI